MDGTENDYAEDMRCIAEFALEEECLEGAVLGIAKQITDKGWNSLTSRQQEVFNTIAISATRRECKRCGTGIAPSELCLGGDYCGWCDHQMGKGD